MAEVLIPCDHEVATGDTLQEIHGPWRISSVHKDMRHRSDSIKYEVHIERNEHQTTDRLLKKAFAFKTFWDIASWKQEARTTTKTTRITAIKVADQEHASVDTTWIFCDQKVHVARRLRSHRRHVCGEEVNDRCVEVRKKCIAVDEEDPVLRCFPKGQNGAATPTACALHTRWLQDLGSVYYSTIFDSYPNKAISKFRWGHVPAPPLFRSWLGYQWTHESNSETHQAQTCGKELWDLGEAGLLLCFREGVMDVSIYSISGIDMSILQQTHGHWTARTQQATCKGTAMFGKTASVSRIFWLDCNQPTK